MAAKRKADTFDEDVLTQEMDTLEICDTKRCLSVKCIHTFEDEVILAIEKHVVLVWSSVNGNLRVYHGKPDNGTFTVVDLSASIGFSPSCLPAVISLSVCPQSKILHAAVLSETSILTVWNMVTGECVMKKGIGNANSVLFVNSFYAIVGTHVDNSTVLRFVSLAPFGEDGKRTKPSFDMKLGNTTVFALDHHYNADQFHTTEDYVFMATDKGLYWMNTNLPQNLMAPIPCTEDYTGKENKDGIKDRMAAFEYDQMLTLCASANAIATPPQQRPPEVEALFDCIKTKALTDDVFSNVYSDPSHAALITTEMSCYFVDKDLRKILPLKEHSFLTGLVTGNGLCYAITADFGVIMIDMKSKSKQPDVLFKYIDTEKPDWAVTETTYTKHMITRTPSQDGCLMHCFSNALYVVIAQQDSSL